MDKEEDGKKMMGFQILQRMLITQTEVEIWSRRMQGEGKPFRFIN